MLPSPRRCWARTPCRRRPPEAAVIPTELITYQSRGRPIRAVVFRPLENARGAGVLLIHGSNGIGPEQVGLAQKFAADGYLSIVPTYLDAAEDDIVRTAPVRRAWKACAADAIDWLINQGIDRHRTGIIGYSLGSYIAVDSALGNSEAGAVIGIAAGQEVFVLTPPRRHIPVLLIRGSNDTLVTPFGTRLWVEQLREASVPTRLEIIDGARHLMTTPQWDEVYRLASTFFNRNIGRIG